MGHVYVIQISTVPYNFFLFWTVSKKNTSWSCLEELPKNKGSKDYKTVFACCFSVSIYYLATLVIAVLMYRYKLL